jgi:hypothetical protein
MVKSSYPAKSSTPNFIAAGRLTNIKRKNIRERDAGIYGSTRPEPKPVRGARQPKRS